MTYSEILHQTITSAEQLAIRMIKELLFHSGGHTKFEVHGTSDELFRMSFYPDYYMFGLYTNSDGVIIVRATHFESKEARDFELEDTGCVPITDLDQILNEIERQNS